MNETRIVMDISRYRVDGSKPFVLADYATGRDDTFKNRKAELAFLAHNTEELDLLQARFAADGRAGLLVIIQGMDASGKDGSIRAVFAGMNQYGVHVFSFKSPTAQELSHDYLWRLHRHVPQRGDITVFNRSYYEDVLIVAVHKLYENLNILDRAKGPDVVEQRYQQIVNYERYLWENAIVVVKVMLNISKEEQAKRFLSRVYDPTKNWKFAIGDIIEREFWDDYQHAYQSAIDATATEIAPWFIVPADNKSFTRAVISQIVLDALVDLDPQFPKMKAKAYEDLELGRQYLMGDPEAIAQVGEKIKKIW
ncbi:MAG: polyphosphate kinase 2 family protein [Actinomycetia bacterium]|nr:polyphosphate kinase 2 family protein [Actinomycetes bacterium]